METPSIKVKAVGVDLDNTLIDYGSAYVAIAQDLGVQVETPDRRHIRDALRQGADDQRWQEFQSLLYTEGLKEARPADGAEEFLSVCKLQGIRVSIVSHKTSHGPSRYGRRNLREPALLWLESHGITPDGVKVNDVFFEETQDAKIGRIGVLAPNLFIDDLDSVLTHPSWPVGTVPIEYSPGPWRHASGRWKAGFPALSAWLTSQVVS